MPGSNCGTCKAKLPAADFTVLHVVCAKEIGTMPDLLSILHQLVTLCKTLA